jgi:hypothetical protein
MMGKFTGKPWLPVDFPLNQSNDINHRISGVPYSPYCQTKIVDLDCAIIHWYLVVDLTVAYATRDFFSSSVAIPIILLHPRLPPMLLPRLIAWLIPPTTCQKFGVYFTIYALDCISAVMHAPSDLLLNYDAETLSYDSSDRSPETYTTYP